MSHRETLAILLLALAPLAAGLAAAQDGGGSDGAAMGLMAFAGTHLAFRAEGDHLTEVVAGGTRFLDRLSLAPLAGNTSVAVRDGYGHWQDDDGHVLGVATDTDSPALRIDVPANGTLTLVKSSGAAVADFSPLPGTRIATTAGVALVKAPGATQGGTLDRLTWTFPRAGNVTILFLLGANAWTETAATHDAGLSARVGGDASRQWLQAAPPGGAVLQNVTFGERVTLRTFLPPDGEYHAVRLDVAPALIGADTAPEKLVVRVEMPEAPEMNYRDNFGKLKPREDLPGITGSFGPFYNLTLTPTSRDVTLLLRGYGDTRITFERDVSAPSLLGGVTVSNLTHQSALVFTHTTEYALVDLTLTGGDHSQEYPTSVLSLDQTFPVQGLKANRTYTYTLVAHDVAGNTQQVAAGTFKTPDKPAGPKPVITSTFPTDKAELATAPAWVEARFTSPDSPVDTARVRLFVDLREVPASETQGLVVNATGLRYAPLAGFAPGAHVVSVEVTNAAGETTAQRWTFTVAKESTPTLGVVPSVLALAALATLAVRRR